MLLPFALGRPSAPGELRVGVVAGLCLLVGYLFQTVGLQYTSSTTSAFITYLLVVFVPILTAVMTRRPPERTIIVAVVLAVTGLLLMSGGLDGFGRGGAAHAGRRVPFAVHILILSRTSHRYDPVRLTCWQVAVVSLACIGPGIGSGGYAFDAGVWAAAVFCGVAPRPRVPRPGVRAAGRARLPGGDPPPDRTGVRRRVGYVTGERLGGTARRARSRSWSA